MENKYEKVIEEMVARCELLTGGETRAQCCNKQGKDCSISSEVDSSQYQKSLLNEYATVSFVIAALLAFLAFVAFAVKRKWGARAWSEFSDVTKAIIAGWGVWVCIVLSCLALLEPYGSKLYLNEYQNLFLWLVLPPACAVAVFFWIRRFVFKRL